MVQRSEPKAVSTKSIPIIVLTARGKTKELFDVKSNVTTYLEKPFDPKKLRETVAAVLGLTQK